MSQHDQNIANDTGAAVRADINLALGALFGNSSGLASPGTTIAYQWWADTTTGLLKIRNAANSAWVTVGTMATTNLGLAPTASPTFTGTITAAAMNLSGAFSVAAAQKLYLDGVGDTYIWEATANQIATIAGGAEITRVTGTGLGVFCTPSFQFHLGKSNNGSAVEAMLENTSNTASSDAKFDIRAGGSSGGDAQLQFIISGSTSWGLGIDNSDSDKFKLSSGGALGTNDFLSIDATGAVVLGSATPATGYTSLGDLTLPAARNVRANNTAKAWANWDASSATPTLGDSFNVTSLTDNGVGDTTVNFTNAIGNATYAVCGSGKVDDNSGNAQGPDLNIKRNTNAQVAASCRISTCNGAGAANDVKTATVVFFGD